MFVSLTRLLHRRRWLLLLLAAPFLLFPTPLTTPVLFVVPGLMLIAWLAGDEPFPRTPLNPALLLLSAMVLVSMWATYDLAVSLPKIAGVMLGIGAFYVVASYSRRTRGFWWCLAAFCGTGASVALVSLLATRWTVKFGALEYLAKYFDLRAIGLVGLEHGINPNEVAGALLWTMPVLLALLLVLFWRLPRESATSRRWRVVVGFLLAQATLLSLFVFVLCQSRSAYLGVGIACLALLPIVLPHRWRRLYLVALIVVVLGVVAFVAQFGVNALLDALLDARASDSLSKALATFGGRTELWSRALAGIAQFPVTGMGMNTFRYRSSTFAPPASSRVQVDIAHAHNEFLQAALDLGIPGLVAFVALYVGAFWMLSEVWTRAAQSEASAARMPLDARAVRLLVLGLGGGLLAHLLYGMTDAVALGAKPGVLFWMLLGLIVGLRQVERDAALPVGD